MSQRYLGGIITANPTTPTMTSESGVWTLEQQFQYSSVWSPEIVGNSLRFRSSASAYLNRTFGAGNQQKWTWSGWVKRGTLGAYQTIFGQGTGSTGAGYGFIRFDNNDVFTISASPNGATSSITWTSTPVYRDPSAWYHVVAVLDTTQATAANRFILYVNGVSQAGSFSTTPSQNANIEINRAAAHQIGVANAGGLANYLDGYMAEIYFVDGQALTPSSFGAFDSTGTWQPLPYTGTYGANGFYIDFTDNSAVTAAALGKDYSGNGNNWTPNNFSLTAGVTYDWMLDTPTNSDNGGNGRGNYCVISPFQIAVSGPLFSLTDGNLNYSCSSSTGNAGRMYARGTMSLPTGKTYWEVKVTNTNPYIGIGDTGQLADNATGSLKTIGVYNTGQTTSNTSATYTGTTFSFTTNDYIGFAFDGTAMTLACYKNGSLIGTWSGIDSTVTWLPVFGVNASASSTSMEANFGQRPFNSTPPTGFKALNTQNLPDPNIMNGGQVMAATLWTGDGTSSARSITNTGFKPDFVWVKARSSAAGHRLYDSIRGTGISLASNSTAAEGAETNPGVSAFNSSGFSITSPAGAAPYENESGTTYVAWNWQAGQGTTSSNTSGSITSTASVNATAGFSVVTFTANGSAGATVGHGLGVAPAFYIIKCRSNAGTDWMVYHQSLGASAFAYLDLTNAAVTGNNSLTNGVAPSSTLITLGGSSNFNVNNYTNVIYAWAAVAGYSAFGSYTGNGSSDGAFIYCGFRPRYILHKATSTTSQWMIWDTSRNTYNVLTNAELLANSSAAEGSGAWGTEIDILSNGFKFRGSDNSNFNYTGVTYIYAAFAENPFKIARAR